MPLARIVLAILALLISTVTFAQPAGNARLLVTVVDVTGAILPGASVTVVPEGPSAGLPATVAANDSGVATIAGLAPGRYTIRAEFSGFDAGERTNVRVRPGDNKQELELGLTAFEDTIEVGRDAQSAAADPNGGSLSTQLTADEIEALPDDPNDLVAQLVEMAGGAARVRIDGFNGGTLPSRDVIRSIRIVRDTFPAENHSAETDGIDIITQAGVGPIRGGVSTRMSDSMFSGENPFVEVAAPEHSRNVDGNLGGTIRPNKSSFSLFFGGRQQYDTPVATITTIDGKKESRLLTRRANEGWNFNGMVDYALTAQHMLRAGYSQNQSERRNLGIGGFDLPGRAYSTESSGNQLRLQETGPLGANMFVNTRLQLRLNNNASHSDLEAQTIRILDASTRGGAQVKGGRNQKNLELSSDLNYVRGIHTMRAGLLIEGLRSRSDDATNYLGTYVFSSQEDFDRGLARNFTRRIGDPLIEYSHVEAAVYLQDDLRLRPNLTFSPGLRYEAQTHLDDWTGFAPRLGLTWAPGENGRTTIRTSWGIFYNWLPIGVYEQTLRVDGVRQREINIDNPPFPDPGDHDLAGVLPSVGTNKYLMGDLKMERVYRYSAAIDRTISPKLRASMTFAVGRYTNQLRGENLNAPVEGVRPDPDFANVIRVVSDASMDTIDLVPEASLNLAGGVRNANTARWNPRRTVVRFNYRYRLAENNTDGAFNVPPSGSLDDQWSYASSDQRHRFRASVSTQALRNLNAQVSWNANSGSPYTITTGEDDNSDSIFNDRPPDTPRNSARLPWRSTLSANLSYTIPLGGGASGGDGAGRAGPRGRGGRQRGITISVSVDNLTNRANYSGFSGVMTSQYFMQATSVSNPREMDFSLRFNF